MTELARFDGPAAATPEELKLPEARLLFQACEKILEVPASVLNAERTLDALEKELRHNITTVVTELNESALSEHRKEVISEFLFRRLGDFSSAYDNLRLIARDIQSLDLEGILARHEGR